MVISKKSEFFYRKNCVLFSSHKNQSYEDETTLQYSDVIGYFWGISEDKYTLKLQKFFTSINTNDINLKSVVARGSLLQVSLEQEERFVKFFQGYFKSNNSIFKDSILKENNLKHKELFLILKDLGIFTSLKEKEKDLFTRFTMEKPFQKVIPDSLEKPLDKLEDLNFYIKSPGILINFWKNYKKEISIILVIVLLMMLYRYHGIIFSFLKSQLKQILRKIKKILTPEQYADLLDSLKELKNYKENDLEIIDDKTFEIENENCEDCKYPEGVEFDDVLNPNNDVNNEIRQRFGEFRYFLSEIPLFAEMIYDAAERCLLENTNSNDVFDCIDKIGTFAAMAKCARKTKFKLCSETVATRIDSSIDLFCNELDQECRLQYLNAGVDILTRDCFKYLVKKCTNKILEVVQDQVKIAVKSF
jgi:hypothetical protein